MRSQGCQRRASDAPSRHKLSSGHPYNFSCGNRNKSHHPEQQREVPNTLPKRMADLVPRVDPVARTLAQKVKNPKRHNAD